MASSSSNDFPHRRGRGPFKGMHDYRRRKGFYQYLPRWAPWRVVVNDLGVPVILDERGTDPLSGTTGLERLRNRWLASRAPELFESLILVAQRFETIHSGWARDDDLVVWAVGTVLDCQPSMELERQFSGEQIELDFEHQVAPAGEDDSFDHAA